MQAFLPFLIVPATVTALSLAGQWLSERSLPPAAAVSVPQMPQLPPNVRELMAPTRTEESAPLRLAALMPADVAFRLMPPPPPPDRRSAAERFRLSSTLLGDGVPPSAVIDGQVVQEGERFGGYRLVRVAADHVWVSGPQGRERVDLGLAPALLAAAPVMRPATGDAGSAPARASLPPAPAAEALERQFRRLLENLAH